MTNQTQLDCHSASDTERQEAFRNVHDVWGQGLSLEDHLQIRLNSVQHNRANWYVGCLDGRVVTSLGAYPIQFRHHGKLEAGIAIGAVHTVADFRGNGFAPQLIRWVEEFERGRGAVLSMLYSDINPDYYARLGYELCPSWNGWFNSGDERFSRIDSGAELRPCSAAEELDSIMQLYDSYHAQFAVSIARSDDYWRFLTQKAPKDEFFWLQSNDDQHTGFVRLSIENDEAILCDFSLADRSETLLELMLTSTISLARTRGAAKFGGWLPDCQFAHDHGAIEQRTREITMIKSLTSAIHLDDDTIHDSQYFHEIDHV